MVRAFLGLGSNVGDRAGYLREAVRGLDASDVRVTGRSGVYETVPWGVTGQATYLNQVLAVETTLSPNELLGRCRAVEAALGRVRSERWGPRTVDVDILLYGDSSIREPDLTVPHPDLARRAFVLVPLAEVAPGLRLPDGTAVDSLLAASPDRGSVWRWDDADSGTIGHEVRWYDTLSSTNELARREAEAGAAEGTVIVAEQQTAGRGRLGRVWASPPGGLWLSIILRPNLAAAQTPLVGLAASIATAAAIEETTALHPRLKWPNDVLVGGRKVAGLLLETSPPAWLVAGIGVNVNVAPEALPSRPRYPATSLAAALGRSADRGRLMRALLRRLNRDYDEIGTRGADGILAQWRARSETLGRAVQVSTASETIEGVAYDVDETGALLVRTHGGADRRIVAGDVTGEVEVGVP
jgi:BirA family biotin operon repressor/biotin-[acetyl-CoA-carboxylase] ligase